MQIYDHNKLLRPLSYNHRNLTKICISILYTSFQMYNATELTMIYTPTGTIIVDCNRINNEYLDKQRFDKIIISFSYCKEAEYLCDDYSTTSFRLSTNKTVNCTFNPTFIDTIITKFKRYNELRKVKLGSRINF